MSKLVIRSPQTMREMNYMKTKMNLNRIMILAVEKSKHPAKSSEPKLVFLELYYLTSVRGKYASSYYIYMPYTI